MKKILLFVLSIIFLMITWCTVSSNNSDNNQKKSFKIAKKVKLDRDALYIKNNYLLLKKIDINLFNFDEKKIILDFLKSLIYDTYHKKFFIQQQVFKHDNMIMFTLTLKDPFWKNNKKFIIRKKCSKYFEDLKKIEDYIKNPTKGDSYYYGYEIQVMNRTCHIIRMGGGHCKIIYNINELYKLFKENYERCTNKYENNRTLRQTKILIKLSHMKKRNVDVIIINVIKKRLYDNNTIKEKYIVLKTKKKLYILSLDKKSKFSKIFNKELKMLSYDDLIAIKNIFN